MRRPAPERRHCLGRQLSNKAAPMCICGSNSPGLVMSFHETSKLATTVRRLMAAVRAANYAGASGRKSVQSADLWQGLISNGDTGREAI